MPADTIRLPIGCPGCGGHLTAVCGPEDPKAKINLFMCPYCDRPQAMDLGGTILYVLKRTDPSRIH